MLNEFVLDIFIPSFIQIETTNVRLILQYICGKQISRVYIIFSVGYVSNQNCYNFRLLGIKYPQQYLLLSNPQTEIYLHQKIETEERAKCDYQIVCCKWFVQL